MKDCLILLRTWSHTGVTGYEEHLGDMKTCRDLAEKAMQTPGIYQARATAYTFGRGRVINAFNAGRYVTGWRFPVPARLSVFGVV